MKKFKVKSPDGKEFIISAPDGATPEQLKSKAQSLFSQVQPQPQPAQPKEQGIVSKAWDAAAIPAQKSREGLDMIAQSETLKPELTGNLATDLIRGTPQVLAETAAEVAPSMIDRTAIATAGAGMAAKGAGMVAGKVLPKVAPLLEAGSGLQKGTLVEAFKDPKMIMDFGAAKKAKQLYEEAKVGLRETGGNKFFRGGSTFDAAKIDPAFGVNITPSKAAAEFYAKSGGKVEEFLLRPGAKVVSREEMLTRVYPGWKTWKTSGKNFGIEEDMRLVEEAKNLGFDAIKANDSMVGLRVINPAVLSASAPMVAKIPTHKQVVLTALRKLTDGTLSAPEAFEARKSIRALKKSKAYSYDYLDDAEKLITEKVISSANKADQMYVRAIRGEQMRNISRLNKNGTTGPISAGIMAKIPVLAPFLSPALQGAGASAAGAAAQMAPATALKAGSMAGVALDRLKAKKERNRGKR